MLTMDQAREVIGATAYTSGGDRIGRIGQLYLDDATEQPEWITVSTGLFGTKESFVPLAEAQADGDRVTVPYTKDQVKGAPRVEAGEGHLSEAEEAELYRYYGLPESGPFTQTPETQTPETQTPETQTPETQTRETGTPDTGFAPGTSGTLDDPTAAGPAVEQHPARHRLRRYPAGDGDEPVP